MDGRIFCGCWQHYVPKAALQVWGLGLGTFLVLFFFFWIVQGCYDTWLAVIAVESFKSDNSTLGFLSSPSLIGSLYYFILIGYLSYYQTLCLTYSRENKIAFARWEKKKCLKVKSWSIKHFKLWKPLADYWSPRIADIICLNYFFLWLYVILNFYWYFPEMS